MAIVASRKRRLHAYGKLPWSRDFIWLDLESRAARGFRAFIDDSAPTLCEALSSTARALRLYFSPACFGASLWADVRASSDEGGMRPYPFALFVTDDGDVGGDSRIASNSSGLFAGFARAHGLVRHLSSTHDFEAFGAEQSQQLELPSPESASARDAWSRTLTTDLFAFGAAATGSRDAFVQALWRLQRLITLRRAGATAGRRAPSGLWFSLVSDMPASGQVDVWLQTVAQSPVLDPVGLWMPEAVAPSSASAWLCLRPPQPPDILSLLGQRPDGVLDLRQVSPRADLPDQVGFAARVRELDRSRRWYVSELPALLAACTSAT